MDLSLQIPFFSFPERMLSLEKKRNLNLNFSFSRTFFLFLPSFYHSKHFTTIPLSGETKKPLTLTEGRLGLTHKRLNCPTTGTHPSPRSASVWRSANRSGLLSSTSRWTPCTLWSLMGNTASDTLLGIDTWKSLIGSEASLQLNCNKEGFNAVGDSPGHSKARIGIIGNRQWHCPSCNSRIGFGTGGKPNNTNSCGNGATHTSDNGEKHIKAMGYILVQWKETDLG